MAITRRGGDILGLAADAKPNPSLTEVGLNFIETDTRKKYVNDGTAWILQELNRYKRFTVSIPASTYYVLDQNGKVEGSGTDIQVVLQAILDAMPTNTTYRFV